MEKNTETKKHRSIPAKIARGVGIFFLSIIALVILILILIQLSPVQDFARGKIVGYLRNKLETQVDIKRLDIDFPKMLVLEGVYIEDKQKDTLISGNQLKVDISMLKLINGELQINEINLNGVTLKVKRQLPDTTFNFQFIADAFSSAPDTTVSTDTSSMKMAIDKIIIDKTRLVYKDVVTGNDVDVYLNHFDTHIDTFDPSHFKFDVPDMTINGLTGTVIQTRPLQVAAVPPSNPSPQNATDTVAPISFSNKEMLLKNINFTYVNKVSDMSSNIAFEKFAIHPNKIDLQHSVISLKDIELDQLTGYVKMGRGDTTSVKLTNENDQPVAANDLPWKVTVDAVRFNNNSFAYDDITQPKLQRGMDYAHMNISDFTLHINDFLFHKDTIAANIVKGEMQEKSGFQLNNFEADVVYTDKGASIKDLLIKTPSSQITRSAVFRYPSLEAVQKDMGLLELDVDLNNSYLSVQDILTLVPAMQSQPAFRNPSSKLYLDARLTGSLNRLNIQQFEFRGLSKTNIKLSGIINNSMDPNKINADLTISKFSTGRADIIALSPPGTLPKGISLPETINLNGKLRGGMQHLEISRLQLTDSRNTVVDITGVINNAADPKKVNADLKINKFAINRTEILALAPPGSIPANITIPQNILLTGSINGGMNNIATILNLSTSLGSAKLSGKISNALDSVNARYAATISATDLNVGAITQQPENVGIVNASFTVNGVGYDLEKANATLKGAVTSAEIKKYLYHDLTLNGTIANQKFDVTAAIQDPNIDLNLTASGDMGGDLPGFMIKANVDSIKTLPLHLTTDPIIYHGNLVANVPQLNLDALNGSVFITNSVLVMNGKRISLDTLALKAEHSGNQQNIALNTPFATATINGQYKLEQLGDIMLESIQPYYAIDTLGKTYNIDPYNFTINAVVRDHPTLRVFVPDLTRFDGATLSSTFTSSDGWNAKMNVPHVVYGTNTVDSLVLTANASNGKLNLATNVEAIKSGSSIELFGTNLTAILADNKIDFNLAVKDRASRNKYRLGGVFIQEPDSIYSLALKADTLLLNYDRWTLANDNMIRFGSSVVNARNFNLSKGNQQLKINSLTTDPNSPLKVEFNNFNLGTLTAFAMPDTFLVNGNLNGDVLVRNMLVQPNFTTDLNINNLSVKNDTIGDINIKVNNNTQNVFATNVTITGKGNDVSLTGNYYLKPANNSNFDFNLNINKLPFETLAAASMGAIDSARGNLTGKVAINGTVDKPNVDGGINFNNTGFNLTMLGSYFTIDNETIKIDKNGIRFNTFTVRDSANNSLVLDGLAGTSNFVNYNFDLTLKARDFRAINSQRQPGSLYFGQLYFNTNMSIKGTETSPVVDGSLRINENTNFSLILPQAEPGVADRRGVIEFVDMDAPMNDSLFAQTLAKYDSSFNTSTLTGFDISTNIEVVKEANFNIIVDEANGDFLNIKGTALLTAGIDPSGKITMTGTYEIASGAYELSFNFLKRRFEIAEGSKLTWTGEPTTANIDITAIYVANTAPIDLVDNQIQDPNLRGYYQQKLPFQVKLIMQGELMKPDLSFDITLPTENNARVSNDILSTVNTKLDQVRSEPSELNKQVFALLLLNRFVGDNPFQSSGGGGGFNATSFAKQSVSKILTEQLNRLAGDLISGVDISFDVNSADDYSTGVRQDRTDFNVALSKRLLNDRLKVTVGTNYELEGPQQSKQNGSNVIGNVSVDYLLTKDGRYLLRGYRKNDYEAVVEGFVIETGLKFIISVDYNKFKQIFQGRKKRQNRKNKDQDLQETANTENDDTDKPVSFSEKIPADVRRTVSALVNETADENYN